MSDQNSSANNIVRPDELMAELDLKKSTYYDDLNYLGIKADKDENQRAYLTNDQANQVRALRSHVSRTGKRDGFESGALTVSSNNELATNQDTNDSEATNIYVQKEEPTASVDSDIVREAKELAARGMAMNDLLKIQLASKMTFDDLDADLKEKVAIALSEPKLHPKPTQ
ncbi:MAG: hypothetical protein QNJ38_14390 [Prochloraceae cyanobacterium]|nr:hypothetical protein [Prochloraceae cyanobacterium]